MKLAAIGTVFRFECSRTLTVPRLLAWSAMALFPAGLLLLIQSQGGELQKDIRPAAALFVLIPEVLCVMGLLLWATPIVHSEVEGKTWTYLAVSPAGKAAILIGKYLTAVFWTALTAWLSLALCLLILRPEVEPWRLRAVLSILVLLSCLSYGTLYALLGVIFLRRAMVFAVAYTFVSEVLIGFVPAVINQLTVQFHLRSLLVDWMDYGDRPEFLRMNSQLFSTAPAWQHVVTLLVITVVLLTLAVLLLRRRD